MNYDAMDVSWIIRLISIEMKRRADVMLAEDDLTSAQLRILMFLKSRGGSAAQKAIEEHLGVKHPTVIGLLKRLEKKGYVITAQDSCDARKRSVFVTEKVKRISDAFDAHVRALNGNLTAGLAEEETRELKRLLGKLHENIKSEDYEMKFICKRGHINAENL